VVIPQQCSKLINAAVFGKVPPISPAAINLHAASVYHKIENLNLAIESAKAIGCTVVNIIPTFILEKREHIVLGLIWQVIKVPLPPRRSTSPARSPSSGTPKSSC
jgi:ABC-type methionine transport system permease subunit